MRYPSDPFAVPYTIEIPIPTVKIYKELVRFYLALKWTV
jgi:hypothetical protein